MPIEVKKWRSNLLRHFFGQSEGWAEFCPRGQAHALRVHFTDAWCNRPAESRQAIDAALALVDRLRIGDRAANECLKLLPRKRIDIEFLNVCVIRQERPKQEHCYALSIGDGFCFLLNDCPQFVRQCQVFFR